MTILVNKITIPELGIEIDLDIKSKVINKGSSFENYNTFAFYINVVKPNLKEFYKDELSTRKVINACITLYHLSDWYICDKKSRNEFKNKIPFNDVIESISNGTEHCNKEKKYQTGTYESSYNPTKLIVDDGKNTYNLVDILKKIENFWDDEFGRKKNKI